jgi:hypothetical protein
MSKLRKFHEFHGTFASPIGPSMLVFDLIDKLRARRIFSLSNAQ